MGEAIGIDLGTTYSAAARVDPATGRPVVLPNAEGALITPSVVWCGCDPPAVGEPAKAEQRAGASDVAAFFKRGMGEPHLSWNLGGRDYSPIDLSALVLKKLKTDAEAHLKTTVTDAVITVPAYFNDDQRKATLEAGKRAGLNVLRIINEPTAAALAYGVGRSGGEEYTLVYDLGGGTFDVTLVKITPTTVDVLSTDGDHELGGKDWDDRVARYVAGQFRDEHGLDPLDDGAALGELLTRCEDAKRRLSSVASVKVSMECGGVRASYELTRTKFEQLTVDLMERTQKLTEQVLAAGKLAWGRLNGGVLLVGGSTRMPMVHEYVRRMSGQPPRTGVEVDHAVALGAAIQAAMDRPKRNLRIVGEKKVTDVVPRSLGMVVHNPENDRYENSILIPKNTPAPCRQAKAYQIRTKRAQPNQLDVYMLQGESVYPGQCYTLGKYTFPDVAHVSGLPAIIDIEFGYDRNQVVTVAAVQRSTGRALTCRVERLPDDLTWLGQVTRGGHLGGGSNPYTKFAGQQHIPTAVKDQYGNPKGTQYDLAEDDAFEGMTIAVLHLYTGEGFDFAKPDAALREKGFAIHRWTSPPPIDEFRRVLDDSCQLWLISDRSPHLSRDHARAIKEFFDAGHGVYIWGDNDPYYADANVVAGELLGWSMSGNSAGSQTLQLSPGPRHPGFAAHLITTGLEFLFEGITVATINGPGAEPLMYGSDGNLLAAFYGADGKRAILDGGFTRLFCNWDTAGTGRYVKNAAAWLVNYERMVNGVRA